MARISESTIRRLSKYYRSLLYFDRNRVEMVSSKALAERDGVTPVQVRKDLSCFGNFGTRGMGYSVLQLREAIARILGLHRKWNVAIVGAGHLGTALISYREFAEQGFNIVAVFDKNPQKIGQVRRGVTVYDIRDLSKLVKEKGIQMAIIAVPANSAQSVADALVAAGVEAILNFAPTNLSVPEDVTLRNVNMAIELEALSYALTCKELKKDPSRAE